MGNDVIQNQVNLAPDGIGDGVLVLESDFDIDSSLKKEPNIITPELDATEELELTDLVSAGDLFGAETKSINLTEASIWFEPLTQNIFFDTELTYSSHEQMFLDDRNILYDESPLNSLIFVENGISLLHVSDKKADIFLGSRTETTINGDNAQVNLFTTLEHSTDFTSTALFLVYQ